MRAFAPLTEGIAYRRDIRRIRREYRNVRQSQVDDAESEHSAVRRIDGRMGRATAAGYRRRRHQAVKTEESAATRLARP